MSLRRSTASKQLGTAVLAYLLEQPRHTYELGKLFRQRDKLGSIGHKHSSLYMVVDQLLRDGYIERHETERRGQRPERTVYRLTASGHDELRARMREQLSRPQPEPGGFEAALSIVAAMPPDETAELLDERDRALTEQLERTRAHRESADAPRLFLVEHEYRAGQLEAELAFVRWFREAIRADAGGLTSFWTELRRRIGAD